MDNNIIEVNEQSEVLKINKNGLVKQHNALISAKHGLTQVQMKIILSVIGKIHKDDEDFKNYCFYIKDFIDIISIDGGYEKNYTFIKESIKSIMSKPLEIKTQEGHLICNWLSGAETIENSGLVKLRFDPALKPYLLQLKEQFTIFKLDYILTLDSIYSIRIYELLKQFSNTNFRIITIEEFRHILEIPASYKISSIKDILSKAKKEIGAKTDIEFNYKLEKIGKKFNSIKFSIKDKNAKKKKKPSSDENIEKINFHELADKCLQEQKCETIKILMPYCKLCKNYCKKLEQIKHISSLS